MTVAFALSPGAGLWVRFPRPVEINSIELSGPMKPVARAYSAGTISAPRRIVTPHQFVDGDGDPSGPRVRGA